MWFGPNLQRSYKYMMFASKKPSLRLDQSDLKCKNGCEYFGNPQWQGYCSKCHREQMSRQRRAEKATSSTPVSSTLPRPEQKKPERGAKLASHSSFSKFEEKRMRQSETLKKANILKFSVFKKSSNTEEQDNIEKRQQEFKIPPIVMERMKRDFRARFPNLLHQVDRESRSFVVTMVMDVIKYANLLTVDELSERVQRHYQRFIKHMDTSQHFSNIDADTKELLIDFVEKHAMTYLHDLPSVVFSPVGTDDERLDRAMSERIQQLSWVGEQHLECKLDRGNAGCRQLLYKAISELLCMDSACNPGGKLRAVRRACRHVLRLCAHNTHTHAAPASADDLLPALIFTVLKANPPRLVSNINFVTRFCNAQRLMTGEGGYYFTNLCCAVSFIENLTADSLNMDKKEFECYMAMPASIGGSAWAAALSLCGAACEAEEQRKLALNLIQEAQDVTRGAEILQSNAETFEEQIAKKVKDVLEKTPLEITPRRLLPRLSQLRNMSSAELQDLKNQVVPTSQDTKTQVKQVEPLVTIEPVVPTQTVNDTVLETEKPPDGYLGFDTPTPPKSPTETININTTLETDNPDGCTGFETPTPPKSPQNLDTTWDLKQTNSLELLTPSPLGFTPFDSRSVDELMTPDEFGAELVAPGLSNINYDIDLSDFSAENSAADDPPKDPFSPEVLKKEFDPFAPLPSGSNVLKSFDEFSLVDTRTNIVSDPFETVQSVDPFSPILQHKQERDPFSPIQETTSILDNSDSPSSVCLLPSPLQPQTSGKHT